jgi:hypothetical protein
VILLLSGIGGIQSKIYKRQTKFELFRGFVHKIESFLQNSGRFSTQQFVTMYANNFFIGGNLPGGQPDPG